MRAQGLAAHLRTDTGRMQCLVENISLGGMFVRTDKLEQVGTDVAVLLVKPGWKKQLTLTARITSRIDGLAGQVKRIPGMGLQFTAMDGDCHERLRSLLRQLGAPDEQAGVVVEDDSVEVELRALDPSPPAPAPRAPAAAEARAGTVPTARSDGAKPADLALENARLKVQLKGLVMQLSDVQQLMVEREAQIERLREELENARAALQRALRGQ